MSQVSTGLRSVLSSALVYETFQRLIGSPDARSVVVHDHLQPAPGQRVLDIGCGPGDILRDLSEVEYVGFDPNPAYIRSANERYGDRGRFFTAGVGEVDAAGLGTFDRILAKGVLHHVDDRTARDLFSLSAEVLRDGGYLVTMDPGYVDGQSPIARAIIKRDRGQAVRTPQAYESLASEHFKDVETAVRTDLLRIPFTHVILTCRTPLGR